MADDRLPAGSGRAASGRSDLVQRLQDLADLSQRGAGGRTAVAQRNNGDDIEMDELGHTRVLSEARDRADAQDWGPIQVDEEGQEGAAHVAQILEGRRLEIQNGLPDGYECLVRFYVKDEGNKEHPGLNSWAYLERQTTEVPELDPWSHLWPSQEPRSEEAQKHMKQGHDAPGAEVEKSSFVSTTEDVKKLVKTDSPYNEKRSKALAERSEGAMKKRPRNDLLRKALMGGRGKEEEDQVVEKAPGGKEVSDRIVHLMFGHGNETGKRNLKLPVATHVAFLVVPQDRLHRPEDASEDDCCVLEREVTIFAPDVDLAAWVVHEVENVLPTVAERVR